MHSDTDINTCCTGTGVFSRQVRHILRGFKFAAGAYSGPVYKVFNIEVGFQVLETDFQYSLHDFPEFLIGRRLLHIDICSVDKDIFDELFRRPDGINDDGGVPELLLPSYLPQVFYLPDIQKIVRSHYLIP